MEERLAQWRARKQRLRIETDENVRPPRSRSLGQSARKVVKEDAKRTPSKPRDLRGLSPRHRVHDLGRSTTSSPHNFHRVPSPKPRLLQLQSVPDDIQLVAESLADMAATIGVVREQAELAEAEAGPAHPGGDNAPTREHVIKTCVDCATPGPDPSASIVVAEAEAGESEPADASAVEGLVPPSDDRSPTQPGRSAPADRRRRRRRSSIFMLKAPMPPLSPEPHDGDEVKATDSHAAASTGGAAAAVSADDAAAEAANAGGAAAEAAAYGAAATPGPDPSASIVVAEAEAGESEPADASAVEGLVPPSDDRSPTQPGRSAPADRRRRRRRSSIFMLKAPMPPLSPEPHDGDEVKATDSHAAASTGGAAAAVSADDAAAEAANAGGAAAEAAAYGAAAEAANAGDAAAAAANAGGAAAEAAAEAAAGGAGAVAAGAGGAAEALSAGGAAESAVAVECAWAPEATGLEGNSGSDLPVAAHAALLKDEFQRAQKLAIVRKMLRRKCAEVKDLRFENEVQQQMLVELQQRHAGQLSDCQLALADSEAQRRTDEAAHVEQVRQTEAVIEHLKQQLESGLQQAILKMRSLQQQLEEETRKRQRAEAALERACGQGCA